MIRTVSAFILNSLLCLSFGVAGAERSFEFIPQVVAVYGDGKSITRDDAVMLLKKSLKHEDVVSMKEAEIKTALRTLITGRVDRVIMDKVLQENNVRPDAAEMIRELRNFHNLLPASRRQSVENELLKNGENFEQSLQRLANDIDSVLSFTFLKWVETKYAANLEVKAEEVETFYRMNQPMFLIPESYTISRIQTADKAACEALYTRLILGERLDGEFRRYGSFNRQELPDDLNREVLALRKDEYSKPRLVGDKWTIYRMDNRSKAEYVPLDEVEDFIRRSLKARKAQIESARVLLNERKKLNFELNI